MSFNKKSSVLLWTRSNNSWNKLTQNLLPETWWDILHSLLIRKPGDSRILSEAKSGLFSDRIPASSISK